MFEYVRELIERNTPEIADSFVFGELESNARGGSYEIAPLDGRVLLRADSAVNLCAAYYTYLREFCGQNISRCGNTAFEKLSCAPVPGEALRRDIPQRYRACMTHDTYSFSACFWDWERWEREIDYMAMNGVNLPLSIVGTEAVCYYTLTALGVSRPDAMQFISGPAYWPFQLTGRLAGYMPMIDVAYLDRRLELGKKIIERQKQLGMTPVLQSFFGLVPRSLSGYIKKMRMTHVEAWCNFSVTYSLIPDSPLFGQLASLYLQKQKKLLGDSNFYAADPFYQTRPPVKGDGYLRSTGAAIWEAMRAFDENAVWVIKSGCVSEALVSAVPKGSLLVLDLDGDMYGGGFYGHDFILGSQRAFGARTSLSGSLAELAENKFAAVLRENPALCGTGYFSDGTDVNPIYTDFAFEMLTRDAPVNLADRLPALARERYGSGEECLAEALAVLAQTCYSARSPKGGRGSVLCARPSTDLRHTAPGDTLEPYYDAEELSRAAQLLLSARDAARPAYRYDVCDVVRQYLSERAGALCLSAIKAYFARDAKRFESDSNAFLKLADELDGFLANIPEFSADTYLKAAERNAILPADKGNFELNVLVCATVFGPMDNPALYDYAWKEWGGFVGGFYLMRWRAFFEMLAQNFSKRGDIVLGTKNKLLDRDIYNGCSGYKRLIKMERRWMTSFAPAKCEETDAVAAASELFDKYRA